LVINLTVLRVTWSPRCLAAAPPMSTGSGSQTTPRRCGLPPPPATDSMRYGWSSRAVPISTGLLLGAAGVTMWSPGSMAQRNLQFRSRPVIIDGAVCSLSP